MQKNLNFTLIRKNMPQNLEFIDFGGEMIMGMYLGKKHSFSEIVAIVECSKGAVQGVIT